MGNCTETEIKLVASPAMLERLAGDPLLAGAQSAERLASTYFDTADGVLARHGAALRLRLSGGGREQTLKLPDPGGAGVRRCEWTVEARHGEVPDPASFPAEPARVLADLLGNAALAPVLTTRIARRARRLRHGGSLIEADFDLGTIEAGGRGEAVCELELELVDGETADLFRLARGLPLGPDLAWSIASKSERGRALAAGVGPVAVLARSPALDAGATTGAALAAIARECLGQVLGNYRLVVLHGLPDAVHQTRVAIRRLRAAFSLFRAGFDPEGVARFAPLWKAVAAALGPARDAQVLLARVEAGMDAAEAAQADLHRHLIDRRAAATDEARAVLGAEAFQHLLIDFALWIEQGPVSAEAADQPFRDLAARVLARRRRGLAKAAGRLRKCDGEALHDLRIDIKKLRYGTQFTQSLFPGSARAAARWARDLRGLQEVLGEVNDLAVAERDRVHLFAGLDAGEAERLSRALCAIDRPRHASRAGLLRRAERKLARIAEAHAWWKAHGEEPGQD